MYIDDPDCADYTRPRNFDAAKLRADAAAIELPNDLERCLALLNSIAKMPTDTYTQKVRKRLFKERVYPHLVKLQQASTVIQTDGGIRVPLLDDSGNVPFGFADVSPAQSAPGDIERARPVPSVSEPSLFGRFLKLFRVY